MFTNILFLILAMLLINAGPEGITPWVSSPWLAFASSILLFMALCAMICAEQILLKGVLRKRSGLILILVQIQLLIYLIIYQFILDAGRIFHLIPSMENVQILNAGWLLFLYLSGLAVYYGSSFIPIYVTKNLETQRNYAMRQMRLLLPFAVPFLFITFALDIFYAFVGSKTDTVLVEWFSISFSLIMVVLMLVFLPYFIQKIWLCKPLEEGELKDRLLNLCQKADFKHAGMKTWTIMHDQLTAGIIGVAPQFRYVMFTDRLLRELSPESIEAILAHEIGHNKHYHLLLYPFILSGMIFCTGFVFYFISGPLINFLEQMNASYPSVLWDFFNPLIIFSLYAATIVVYFRFVFGFFSRLFERQADLYIFPLAISPQHMIDALESVAYATGGYDTPNWHHYSIRQRVEFLKACQENPSLIQAHHRKVKLALSFYFALLACIIMGLIYILVPIQ